MFQQLYSYDGSGNEEGSAGGTGGTYEDDFHRLVRAF
jgi:hypothetical protein